MLFNIYSRVWKLETYAAKLIACPTIIAEICKTMKTFIGKKKHMFIETTGFTIKNDLWTLKFFF